jgi:hypothetical protein
MTWVRAPVTSAGPGPAFDPGSLHRVTPRTGTGTIQLRPEDAAGIGDDEFPGLIRAALAL